MKVSGACVYLFFIAFWITIASISLLDMRFNQKSSPKDKRENASFENPLEITNSSPIDIPRPRFEFPGPYVTTELVGPQTPNNSFSSDSENTTDTPGPDDARENFVREMYCDRLQTFKKWIHSTIRRLEMLHDLHKMQALTDRYEDNYPDLVETKIQHLQQLHASLNRRNSARKTYFLMMFDLERFLNNTPSS